MRVAFSRWTVVGALGLGLTICAASGCQTSGGLSRWSTPSWMSMSNWGWGGASSSTSLAQSKPSTTVPKPSRWRRRKPWRAWARARARRIRIMRPARRLTTPRAITMAHKRPRPIRARLRGQVQPTVGYQTGPYGMSSATGQAGTHAANGYGASANAGYGAASAPAAGYGTSAYGANASQAAAYANPANRTADSRSANGAQNLNPYGAAATAGRPLRRWWI